MDKELNDADFLRDLAERLMHVPVMYGTDQGDVDRLCDIARNLTPPPPLDAKHECPHCHWGFVSAAVLRQHITEKH